MVPYLQEEYTNISQVARTVKIAVYLQHPLGQDITSRSYWYPRD